MRLNHRPLSKTMNGIALSIFASMILLFSCEQPTSPSGSSWPTGPVDISKTNGAYVVDRVDEANVLIDFESDTKDVYFIFSNLSETANASNPVIQNASSITASNQSQTMSILNNHTVSQNLIRIDAHDRLPNLNLDKYGSEKTFVSQSLSMPLTTSSSHNISGTVGSTNPGIVFSQVDNNIVVETLPSNITLRYLVNDVSTNYGDINLAIWVHDDVWTGGTGGYVDTADVTALGQAFLNTGSNNDIYDWVTNMMGAQWGSHSYSNLIESTAANEDIHIYIYDIDGDDTDKDVDPSGSYVIGYYWSAMTYENSGSYISGTNIRSNERNMFYLDSEFVYANATTFNDAVSTLAHEFQHMISWYQKEVYRQVSDTPTWFGEMMSTAVEDILADKLQVDGPRGVTYNDYTAGSASNGNGRLPDFVSESNKSLSTSFNFSSTALRGYALAYSFGAYLLRNFGGPNFVQAAIQNSSKGSNAISLALSSLGYSEDFRSVMGKWHAASLLSDTTTQAQGLQYNIASAFSESFSGMTYNLGSINMHNYTGGGPQVSSGSTIPSVDALSTVIHQMGDDITGAQEWTVSLPSNVFLTVLVTDP